MSCDRCRFGDDGNEQEKFVIKRGKFGRRRAITGAGGENARIVTGVFQDSSFDVGTSVNRLLMEAGNEQSVVTISIANSSEMQRQEASTITNAGKRTRLKSFRVRVGSMSSSEFRKRESPSLEW